MAQTGGYIVAAVGLSSGSTEVLRFTPSGTGDSTFGSEGEITPPVIVSNPLLALQADGEIDVAGNDSSGNFALLQYSADGGSLEWTTGAAEADTPGAVGAGRSARRADPGDRGFGIPRGDTMVLFPFLRQRAVRTSISTARGLFPG